MKDILKVLEEKVEPYAQSSDLTGERLQLFPEEVRHLHSYKIFGQDLLAIPATLIDNEGFQTPFSFVSHKESLEIFESEFRPEVPEDFIQIGNLYGTTEVVVLNKLKNTVHIFHVSDVVDRKWLKRKLDNAICDLRTWIENFQPQTVCCLINPKDYSKWDIFEIDNGRELKEEGRITTYSDQETAWKEYKKLIEASLSRGYQFHYAPKAVREEFKR